MTLRNLSDKQIKTINGGAGYEFPIATSLLGGIFGTLGNLKNLATYAWNGALSVLEIPTPTP